MANPEWTYTRARSLANDAVETLATHRGNLRERLGRVDSEFFTMRADDLPNRHEIRQDHAALRKALRQVKPIEKEGFFAATFERSRFDTLENIALQIWSLYQRIEGRNGA